MNTCEVCGHEDLQVVLDLGLHPLCGDLVEIGSSRRCREYPIQIYCCPTCVTAHQAVQVPKKELFPANYHYRASNTADVLNGMRSLVDACVAKLGDLHHRKVLDVGCNDGSLLSIFREKTGAQTFGIEPTNAARDAESAGHQVVQDYFTEEVARSFVQRFGHPDVITFTNVFAHIEDLPSLLRAVGLLMHSGTTLVVENHYFGSVLDRNQFDTFYHEHPRTYSFTSFKFIAETLGCGISDLAFPSRYGGNIRVMMQPIAQPSHEADHEDVLLREQSFGQQLASMQLNIARWHEKKLAEILELVRQHGPLPAKAFPGRAAIAIKLLGLDERHISAVHEKPGSKKIGHYVPGTRIPIVSDDELDLSAMQTPLLNLAWHINDEIGAYLKGRGFRGQIVNIISEEDFAQPR